MSSANNNTLRCKSCGRLFGYVKRAGDAVINIKCHRCGHVGDYIPRTINPDRHDHLVERKAVAGVEYQNRPLGMIVKENKKQQQLTTIRIIDTDNEEMEFITGNYIYLNLDRFPIKEFVSSTSDKVYFYFAK